MQWIINIVLSAVQKVVTEDC